jgi:Flp pilus assembly CpaF family ATPase
MLKEGNLIHFVDSIVSSAGQLILKQLNDPDVKDVIRQANGALLVDKIGDGLIKIGEMSEVDCESFLHAIAAYMGQGLSEDEPKLEGNLPKRSPFRGERIEASIRPVSHAGPTFVIRKPCLLDLSVHDYIDQGSLSPGQLKQIDNALLGRAVGDGGEVIKTSPKNIYVIGGTGTGKTTFLNAILKRAIELIPNLRYLILEGEPEVVNPNPDYSVCLQTDKDSGIDSDELVAMTLRYSPKRICLGELRRKECFSFLEAANTGHPGSIATIHADSAEEGLHRTENILQQHGYVPNPFQIAKTIGFLIYIERGDGLPRIKECRVVNGYNAQNKKYSTVEVR